MWETSPVKALSGGISTLYIGFHEPYRQGYVLPVANPQFLLF